MVEVKQEVKIQAAVQEYINKVLFDPSKEVTGYSLWTFVQEELNKTPENAFYH